jgi:hypothetical protein
MGRGPLSRHAPITKVTVFVSDSRITGIKFGA